jgi:hypothetical protein
LPQLQALTANISGLVQSAKLKIEMLVKRRAMQVEQGKRTMHDIEKEATKTTRRIDRLGRTSKIVDHKMLSADNTPSGQRALDRAGDRSSRPAVAVCTVRRRHLATAMPPPDVQTGDALKL